LAPGAAAVVQPDHRRAGLHGEIHDLDDLLGVGAREAAAEDGEVLGEDEHEPPVDRAVARDDAVPRDLPLRHAEVGAAVGLEAVELDEAPRVEQLVQALAGRELPLGVLALDAGLAPAGPRGAVPTLPLVGTLL